MPILQRYLIRQFFPVFGACLALFLGLFVMKEFLRLFSLAMMKGIPAWWIIACFLRLLPSFAGMAVPMAFLVACMVTLGALSESGELVALRASGFSYSEIVRPLGFLAAALTAVLLLVNHKLGPDGFHSFKKRTSEAARMVAKVELRPGAFAELGPWRLYARRTVGMRGALEGVYLVKPGEQQGVRINAERGTLRTEPGQGIELELRDGQLQLPSSDPERFTSGRFERYRVYVPLAGVASRPREPDMQELSTARLREKSRAAETPEDKRLEYRVETAVRSAGAFAPFALFWVAAPLGLAMQKRSRGSEFAASLGVMFAFYGLLVVGVSLGRRHAALASIAPWIGDIAAVAFGAWLTRRAASR